MMQLETIGLTESDFELIINGLKALPEKGMAGDLMMDLLAEAMLKKDSDEYIQHQAEKKERQRKNEMEKAMLSENITILQGKLLMLKRQMIESGILKQANDIIGQ